MRVCGTTYGGVVPGPRTRIPYLGGSAGLKQTSLCCMTKQSLGRRIAAPVQSTELDLSSEMLTITTMNGCFVHQPSAIRKGSPIFFPIREVEGNLRLER